MSHTPARTITLAPGRPAPLGAHCVADGEQAGVNFAVWAPDATRLELCLFDDRGEHELQRHDLPCCSEGVWHGLLPGAGPGLVYGLRAHGPWAPHQGHRFNPAKLLLDPWAQEVVGSYGRRGPGPADDAALAAELALHLGHLPKTPEQPDPRDNARHALKARVPASALYAARPPRPRIARDRMVLYEIHVRSLTMRHPAIEPALRGSYAALAHPAMLAHYRELGITTLNLLPVHFRADEAALQLRGLSNHWGYSPIAWLVPETRYWSGRPGTSPAGEFRDMVDTLHAAGIEVVLDVVFNHTAETDASGPTLSLRGLANARYYHLVPGNPAHDQNWTGCGNSVKLAESRVVELVVGALRHWATHYGVDGFRFDLASTLGRDRHGNFNRDAGFFTALQADPILADLKWIAEPWDLGAGGYQLGAFPTGWMEWNDQYRDTMRAWWLRGIGDRGVFAHRLAGSSAQFHHDARAPTASINYLAAHDGFTLRDLVSYDHKHNHANGENNRDGHHHNASWNCGVEGETDNIEVNERRHRLQRALMATLLCSQGTPMLLAGDEIGHSQGGNNNAYCQDNATTWLDWAAADRDLLACTRRLLQLRHRWAALRIGRWLSPAAEATPDSASALWLRADGTALTGGDWAGTADRALAVRLDPGAGKGSPALVLVNPEASPRRFVLPAGAWTCVFDSDRRDGAPAPDTNSPLTGPIAVAARSLRILIDSTVAAEPHHSPSENTSS
ncbi:glycogen debranching enzyme [Thauera humireducens]|uniref:Glycogen debranching enzyme n=1 Tax=Thauera humireducens TaxID=1134435 RepID=A0A127KAJ7_9RHOO|nr:glycogen debranching enzyme [Thauera humireducens]